MSQHDFDIANQLMPAGRTDLNNALQALASLNEGLAEPTVKFASQLWVDTTANILKLRNKANTVWINVANIDVSNNRMEFVANVLHAASTAGLTFKASGGATIGTFSNTGLLTTGAGGLGLGGLLNMNGHQMRWSKGADVASATALTLGIDGNYFDITGTTTITSINTLGLTTVVKLHFDDAVTLTHHATNLIVPGAANYTTAAGDEIEFTEYATGSWRITGYALASGGAMVVAVVGDWDYKSPEIFLALNTSTLFSHGLGAAPTKIDLDLVCKVAAQGYSVGDRIIDMAFIQVPLGHVTKMIDNGSTTQLRIMIPTSSFVGLTKTTRAGVQFSVTDLSTNFAFIVKANL